MSNEANTKASRPAPKARPSAKTITAIAIKPSPIPENDADNNPVFKILYVEQNGKQVLRHCTKTVFQQITNNRLTQDHRNNFRLRCGADGETISSIDKFAKPELNTTFKTAGEENEENAVVFQKHADKTFTLKSQPADTQQAVVDEIVELIHANPESDMDDYLDGRFHVTGITKKGGATMVFVNPVAK